MIGRCVKQMLGLEGWSVSMMHWEKQRGVGCVV